MEKIIFILDVGCDDAMALLLSFYDPHFEIKMLVSTFGNVPIDVSTKNICYIVERFARVDYPVYKGAEKSICSEPVNAEDVHGKRGLGNKIIAENVHKKPANYSGYGALEAMRDYLNKEPGEISIVCVGPLTDVANLITKYPEVKPKIKRIVMEVGSIDGKGSITPYSSFNAYCDPDAVDIVLKSKVPILMTTKEIGTKAFFGNDQRERFRKCGKVGEFVYDLCDGYVDNILKPDQYAIHDSGALLSITSPKIFKRQKMDVTINTTFDKKRGQTKIVPNPKSHITVVTEVDKEKLFRKMEKIYSLSAKV